MLTGVWDRMNEKQCRVLGLVMLFLLFASVIVLSRQVADYTREVSGKKIETKEKPKVVIDVGHGGFDPGKVGIDGTREKDVNLQIGQKLEKYLLANDISVIMTRREDVSLGDGTKGNTKVQDMKKRVSVIENEAPDLAVSIHQNSYPEEEIKGAQVFYHSSSSAGKKLAEQVQKELINRVDNENRRQAKGNTNYYLLKKTRVPLVIVECGFLSNAKEAEMLCDDSYQERLAYAICMGILKYLAAGE